MGRVLFIAGVLLLGVDVIVNSLCDYKASLIAGNAGNFDATLSPGGAISIIVDD